MSLFPVLASAQARQPRLAEDGRTLILLEEVREPHEKRQPSVVVASDAATGARHVRVSGRGITAPPTLEVACGRAARTLPLTKVAPTPDVNLATYEVPKEVADLLLGSPACNLVLVSLRLAIPRDLLRTAWGQPMTGGVAPPIVVGPGSCCLHG